MVAHPRPIWPVMARQRASRETGTEQARELGARVLLDVLHFAEGRSRVGMWTGVACRARRADTGGRVALPVGRASTVLPSSVPTSELFGQLKLTTWTQIFSRFRVSTRGSILNKFEEQSQVANVCKALG